MKTEDIHEGQRIGMLTVESLDSGLRRKMANCRCDCGKRFQRWVVVLLRGSDRCLSCARKKASTTHGLSETDTYASWKRMVTRTKRHPHYLKRGIAVCGRWSSFECFLQDVGAQPSKAHSLDRINSAGNYEPGNVRWVLLREQARNTSRNIHITAFGETKLLIDWSRDKRCSVSCSSLSRRIKSGWSSERAVSQPSHITPCTVTEP